MSQYRNRLTGFALTAFDVRLTDTANELKLHTHGARSKVKSVRRLWYLTFLHTNNVDIVRLYINLADSSLLLSNASVRRLEKWILLEHIFRSRCLIIWAFYCICSNSCNWSINQFSHELIYHVIWWLENLSDRCSKFHFDTWHYSYRERRHVHSEKKMDPVLEWARTHHCRRYIE